MTRLRATFRGMGIAGVVFVVGVVLMQFLPLTNVLGFEYAIGVTTLLSLCGIAYTLGRLPPAGATPWTVAFQACKPLAGWVLIAVGVSLANALRVRNCDVPTGLMYALIFPIAGIPTIVATAMVAKAATTGRRAYFVAYGFVALAAGSTLWVLAMQPTIVAYNPYVGYYAGSIYDASLIGVSGHLIYRVWTVACALVFVGLLSIHQRVRLSDVAIVLVSMLVALGVWSQRGDLGLERDRGYVMATLGGHVETEHFDIYYDAQATDDQTLAWLIYDHEARYAELAVFWQSEPTRRLRSFVYANNIQRGEMMGGRNTLVAKIWLGEMHITWDGLGDELLAHEMSHLFLRDVGTGPLDLSSRYGLLPYMAMVEGSATAAAWGASDLTYHAWAAAIYELELGRDLVDLLGAADFWSLPGGTAYTLSGSFARYLIDTYGPAPFLDAYRAADFETAYNQSLRELVDAWRAFLGEIALTDQQLEVARLRYDRPSLLGQMCARSAATLLENGELALNRRDRDRAVRCFERLLQADPSNTRYRLRIAELYRSAGMDEQAAEHAQQIADTPEAGIAMQTRAQLLLADMRWLAADYGDAIRRLREIEQSPMSSGTLRQVEARLHFLETRTAAPAGFAVATRYLVERPAPAFWILTAELRDAYAFEADPVVAYLLGIRLATAPSEVAPTLLLESLASGQLTQAQNENAQRSLAVAYAHLNAWPQSCNAWRELAAQADAGSSVRAEAEMWSWRCDNGIVPELDAIGAPVE